MNAKVVDFGKVTTPQLHWLIASTNSVGTQYYAKFKKEDYLENYAQKFIEFNELIGKKEYKNYQDKLILDCSNGVGGLLIHPILEKIKTLIGVEVINDSDQNMLNDMCGAEFVHKDQKVSNYFKFNYIYFLVTLKLFI